MMINEGGRNDDAQADASTAAMIPPVPSIGAGSASASAEVPAPVPDVILSLVKDARYVGYTTELLADVVRPWLHPRSSSSGDGNVLAILGPELNLLATLCHWALVRWWSGAVGGDGGGGKSLGMDALGLSYEYVARPASARVPACDDGVDLGGSSPSSPRKDDANEGSSAVSSSSSLVDTFGGSTTTAVMFVASHVLVPYLLRRAWRGGWSRDLTDLFSSSATNGNTRDRGLSRVSGRGSFGGSPPPSPSFSPRRRRVIPGGAAVAVVDVGGVGASGPGDATVAAAESPAREMESLRGSARLAAHEERRRLMIRRSTGGSGAGATTGGEDGDGGDGPAPDGSRDDFGGDTEAETSTAGLEIISIPPSPPPSRSSRLSRRVRDAAWSLLQKVALATHGNDLAATSTVASNRGVGGGVDDATAAGVTLNVGRFGAATVEALRWAARLHVALFLLNGKYNSFIDRAFRVRFRRGGTGSGGVTTTTSRPSYGLVGALILLEVFASAAKASAVAVVDVSEAVRTLLLRHRRRQLRRDGNRNGGESHDGYIRGSDTGHRSGDTGRGFDREEGDDDSAASTLEERVPSMGSQPTGSPPPTISPSSSPYPAPTCGICMGRRGSPAGAPTTCGHVFCWGCIQRWMDGGGGGDDGTGGIEDEGGGRRRRREWCPTCRTPCRPQDVLALYHF